MRGAAILVLLLSACISPRAAEQLPFVPEDERCQTSEGDRQWLSEALAAWRVAAHSFLDQTAPALPQIVTYDSRCSYTLTAAPGSAPSWTVADHGGEITLPNGGKIPPGPNAFNAVTDSGRNFVVMSLPSIWRPVAPKSEIPLEWFLEGIMLHELAHAHQSAVTPDLSFPALQKRLSLPPSVSDDSVQEAFEKNAAYVRDYESERDLLFRAASAQKDAEARALACEALDEMRARRDRYFTGSNSHWTLVDELSLTGEGLGEWISYTWLTKRRGLSSSVVLPKFRGRYWSQEHGLALFLTIDRLVPNWQKRLFSRSPETAEELLALACEW